MARSDYESHVMHKTVDTSLLILKGHIPTRMINYIQSLEIATIWWREFLVHTPLACHHFSLSIALMFVLSKMNSIGPPRNTMILQTYGIFVSIRLETVPDHLERVWGFLHFITVWVPAINLCCFLEKTFYKLVERYAQYDVNQEKLQHCNACAAFVR